MNLQDITTWTVTEDHKARPKNPFIIEQRGDFTVVNVDNTIKYAEFETFATQHTYACSETLLPGDYPSEIFGEPKYQILNQTGENGIYIDCTKEAYEIWVGFLPRKYLPLKPEYLQLKQPMKNENKQPESKEVETIEQAADEILDNHAQNYGSEDFYNMAWLCETPQAIKNVALTAMETYASQFKQPANNEAAVEVIKGRIVELETDIRNNGNFPDYYKAKVNELNHILKLLKP